MSAAKEAPPLANLVRAGDAQTEAVAITPFVFMSRDVELAKKLLAEKTSIRAAELSAADSHCAAAESRLRCRRSSGRRSADSGWPVPDRNRGL